MRSAIFLLPLFGQASAFFHSVAHGNGVDTYDVVFTPDEGQQPAWVDIHLSVNKGQVPDLNYRMSAGLNGQFVQRDVHINLGARLFYQFTYEVAGLATDSEWFSFSEPVFMQLLQPVPQEPDMYYILLTPSSNVAITWADVHYSVSTVDNQEAILQNFRMRATDSGAFQQLVRVRPGEILSYFFTFETQGRATDTEVFVVRDPSSSLLPTNSGSSGNGQQPSTGSPSRITTDGTLEYQVIRADVSLYMLQVRPVAANVVWVDVHFRVNGGALMNYRMQAEGPNLLQYGYIELRAADRLTFSFTHAVLVDGREVGRDSEIFTFPFTDQSSPLPTIDQNNNPAQQPPTSLPIQQQPSAQPVDQGATPIQQSPSPSPIMFQSAPTAFTSSNPLPWVNSCSSSDYRCQMSKACDVCYVSQNPICNPCLALAQCPASDTMCHLNQVCAICATLRPQIFSLPQVCSAVACPGLP